LEGFDGFFDAAYGFFRTAGAWELVPGARPMLSALRADRRRLGIVSDTDGRLFDVLRALDLDGAFDCVAVSSRLGATKRGGGLFEKALAMARVDAANVVHVGDSIDADVKAAQCAGITPVHFDPHRAGGAPPGVLVARALEEVSELLHGAEV